MLHDVVVRNGVSTAANGEFALDKIPQFASYNSMAQGRVAGDTINGAIRRVGQPRALVNHGVGRILANDEGKNAAASAPLCSII